MHNPSVLSPLQCSWSSTGISYAFFHPFNTSLKIVIIFPRANSHRPFPPSRSPFLRPWIKHWVPWGMPEGHGGSGVGAHHRESWGQPQQVPRRTSTCQAPWAGAEGTSWERRACCLQSAHLPRSTPTQPWFGRTPILSDYDSSCITPLWPVTQSQRLPQETLPSSITSPWPPDSIITRSLFPAGKDRLKLDWKKKLILK